MKNKKENVIARQFYAVAISAITLLLSACGFEPLYAQKTIQTQNAYQSSTTKASVNQLMAQTQIALIPDRIGQELRNALLDSITPLGQPKDPQYKLVVSNISQQEIEQALRQDITATRIRIEYNADYSLQDKQGNKLLSGTSISYSSFDVLSSPYSSTMSRKKTDSETAKILANDITLRLAAYFHSFLKEENK